MKVKEYKCRKCGHKWFGRPERKNIEPVQCPKCNRRDWNNGGKPQKK